MKLRRFVPLVLCLLFACTGSSGSRSRPTAVGTSPPAQATPSPSTSPSPETCPQDLDKRVQHNKIGGVLDSMVPDGPSTLVLCHGSTRVVVQGTRVMQLVEGLNRLKPIPQGAVYPCPLLVVGPGYGLFFDYENHDVLLVSVEQSGCRFATNGRRVAIVNNAVMTRIMAMFGAQ